MKLANIDPSDVTVVVVADVPEAFMQLDIRKGTESQPLVIQNLIALTIFGSSQVFSAIEPKKVAVNATMQTLKSRLGSSACALTHQNHSIKVFSDSR